MRPSVGLVVALTICSATALSLHAQKSTPAEVAARLSGRWTINRSLSPAIGAPGRSGPPRGGGPGFMPIALLQRGGGGGNAGPTPSGPGDMTPAEMAERVAMRRLLQISPEVTIKATAENVSFIDARGETTCAVNGKATDLNIPDVQISSKCRWDKQQLRQEYGSTRSKLTRAWSVDDNDRLVLKARVEAIGQDTADATAVFDRVKQ